MVSMYQSGGQSVQTEENKKVIIALKTLRKMSYYLVCCFVCLSADETPNGQSEGECTSYLTVTSQTGKQIRAPKDGKSSTVWFKN